MQRSVFFVPKMDCPAEEQLIRLKLEGMASVRQLDFDLTARRLTVYHEDDIKPIAHAIGSLQLGANIESTLTVEGVLPAAAATQRKLLWAVLVINLSFFFVELVTGWLSGSMGLMADSLDMLADAFVYGISLMAVGAVAVRKKNVARMAGYFQIALALLGFAEVLRRFLGEAMMPDVRVMIGISALALCANALSYWLLARAKSDEAHIKASLIFTSNDIIINAGVILAGGLVAWLGSGIPDLVIGAIVFLIVVRGATSILKLAR